MIADHDGNALADCLDGTLVDDIQPGVSAFAVEAVLSPSPRCGDCGGRGYYGDGEACACSVGAR